MRPRKNRAIPARLEPGQRRFEQWRRTRKGHARIPESLWTSAVKLAGVHGLCRTAQALRPEVRLAKALKQAYGPRADRISDPGQLLLDFGGLLDGLTIDADDLPVEPDEAESSQRRASRRLRTRGRRDIGQLDHLPLIEQVYELTDELCRCPTCQAAREKIGTAVSYTIEYLPGSFVRVRHVQHKYACRHCEQNGGQPEHHAGGQDRRLADRQGVAGPRATGLRGDGKVRRLPASAPAAAHLRPAGLRAGPLDDVFVAGGCGPARAAVV
jgi:hypothetical protein